MLIERSLATFPRPTLMKNTWHWSRSHRVLSKRNKSESFVSYRRWKKKKKILSGKDEDAEERQTARWPHVLMIFQHTCTQVTVFYCSSRKWHIRQEWTAKFFKSSSSLLTWESFRLLPENFRISYCTKHQAEKLNWQPVERGWVSPCDRWWSLVMARPAATRSAGYTVLENGWTDITSWRVCRLDPIKKHCVLWLKESKLTKAGNRVATFICGCVNVSVCSPAVSSLVFPFPHLHAKNKTTKVHPQYTGQAGPSKKNIYQGPKIIRQNDSFFVFVFIIFNIRKKIKASDWTFKPLEEHLDGNSSIVNNIFPFFQHSSGAALRN